MKQAIREQLLRINREFYQSFAKPFSETRQRLQPGVVRSLEHLNREHRVLDLGCGNGELGRYIFEAGHRGKYIGLDASDELLGEARKLSSTRNQTFLNLDLADRRWLDDMAAALGHQPQFDAIFAFAVIHHLPDHDLRLEILKSIGGLLDPSGTLILSVWNFLASPRLSKRIVPWSAVDLSQSELEEGDFLLDWRRGGYGLRYVHHFTGSALRDLAQEAGYAVLDEFLSDGESGHLGRYQFWRTMLY